MVKQKQFSVVLNPEEKKLIDFGARAEGLSTSSYIRRAVLLYSKSKFTGDKNEQTE